LSNFFWIGELSDNFPLNDPPFLMDAVPHKLQITGRPVYNDVGWLYEAVCELKGIYNV